MDGNRGAKGSIKDRLISMMYRFRYNKKKLKEEEYTISKKKEQRKYINNLVEFKENEDINILDSKDKEHLDKVEYNVDFRINSKGIETEQNKFQELNILKKKDSQDKSIDNTEIQLENNLDLEVKLSNIEFRNTGFEETVELKTEIKKVENETVILEEVNIFIEKSIENIEDIEKEVEIIKKQSKEKNQDLEKSEEQYDKLKEKINKLKEQYDAIKDKYDLSEFCILESIKLINNIGSYKTLASLSEIEMMLNICKKEITQIEKIEIVVVEQNKVGEDLENTKEEQNKVKIKFIKSKEKINKYNEYQDTLIYELNEQQEIINKMYSEASKYEKNIRKEFEYSGYGKIFSSMLKIMGGVLTLPFTGKNLFGISLGATIINKNLKVLNQGLDRKEKIVVDYKYEDFSKKISEVKDKVEYTNLILSDSLNEIKKMKEKFNNIFSQFDNVLPEYIDTFNKLNELEKRLLEQSTKLNNIDKKLELTEEKNKQKMKKVGIS